MLTSISAKILTSVPLLLLTLITEDECRSEIVTTSKNFRHRENVIIFDASRLKAKILLSRRTLPTESGRNEVGCKKCISATLQEKGVAV